VIDGNSDTVKKNIQVGGYPTFVLVVKQSYPFLSNKHIPSGTLTSSNRYVTCCKIYVANAGNNTVSVIDGNSDNVKKTIKVGEIPTFILLRSYNEIYVAGHDNVSAIDDSNDTVKKQISLPPPYGNVTTEQAQQLNNERKTKSS
jgi:YVTN family beta-propeller protein